VFFYSDRANSGCSYPLPLSYKKDTYPLANREDQILVKDVYRVAEAKSARLVIAVLYCKFPTKSCEDTGTKICTAYCCSIIN